MTEVHETEVDRDFLAVPGPGPEFLHFGHHHPYTIHMDGR
jgi:hypothetical protein